MQRSLSLLLCWLALLGCGVSRDSGPAATGVATDRLTGHAADAGAVPERVEPSAVDPDSPRRTGKLSDRFPNVVLTTHDDRQVRFYDDLVKDRTVIINFMYTRCTGS